MENQLTTENTEGTESSNQVREYHGLFKKMQRFVCRCGVCTKVSDVMAFDAQDAGKRLLEKGWKTFEISKEGQDAVKVLACKRCGKMLSEAQALKDKEVKA